MSGLDGWTPAATTSSQCMFRFPQCDEPAHSRGLCLVHYSGYRGAVFVDLTNWGELEGAGLCLPAAPRGPKPVTKRPPNTEWTDLPKAKSPRISRQQQEKTRQEHKWKTFKGMGHS